MFLAFLPRQTWTNRPACARHSCRRFPHLKVFFCAKKNRGAIFFGVIQQASQLAWTNRPARARHSCRCFPHVKVFFGVIQQASQLAWTNRPARARHSCRRFPHLKVFFCAKKNREAIFFGVGRYASQLAWTNRPARARRLLSAENFSARNFLGVGGSAFNRILHCIFFLTAN